MDFEPLYPAMSRYRARWIFQFAKGSVEDMIPEEMGKMERVIIDRTDAKYTTKDRWGCLEIKILTDLGVVNWKEVIVKSHIGYRHLMERESAGVSLPLGEGDDVSEEMKQIRDGLDGWLLGSSYRRELERKGLVEWQSPKVILQRCEVGCVSCGSRVRYYKARKSTRDHRRKVVKERVARKREEFGIGGGKGGEARENASG